MSNENEQNSIFVGWEVGKGTERPEHEGRLGVGNFEIRACNGKGVQVIAVARRGVPSPDNRCKH
jgi:hypothetical protein